MPYKFKLNEQVMR